LPLLFIFQPYFQPQGAFWRFFWLFCR